MSSELPKEDDAPAKENNGDQHDAATPKSHQSNRDDYSLKVKPEFILTERSSSLPPIPIVEATATTARDNENNGNDRDNDDNNNNNGTKKGKKNRRGQNKKRPRDVRQDDSEKICMAIIRGDTCPYVDKCRFSHDVTAYMATRQSDIAEVDGGCPNYNQHGFCMFGAMCRVGGNHITKTGENVRKEECIPAPKVESKEGDNDKTEERTKDAAPKTSEEDYKQYTCDVVNFLPRDLQIKLRKNKYRKLFNSDDRISDEPKLSRVLTVCVPLFL